jgi:hypothetical protein
LSHYGFGQRPSLRSEKLFRSSELKIFLGIRHNVWRCIIMLMVQLFFSDDNGIPPHLGWISGPKV